MKLVIFRRPVVLLTSTAIISGFISWWLLQAYLKPYIELSEISPPTQMTSILVSAVDIPAGNNINTELLRSRQVPSSIFPPDLLMPYQATEISGKKLIHSVQAGQPLQKIHFQDESKLIFSELLGEGESALTLFFSREDSHGGLVGLGDRMDVMNMRTGEIILGDLDVIAKGGNWIDASENVSISESLITIRTPLSKYALLKTGLDQGELKLILRNSDDDISIPPVKRVEYIYPQLVHEGGQLCANCY